MDMYAQIAEKIIESQEAIIGPVAIEQAEQVPNLKVDWANHKVMISGQGAHVIDILVGRYQNLFGQISVEVCKEAAHSLIADLKPDQLPTTLK